MDNDNKEIKQEVYTVISFIFFDDDWNEDRLSFEISSQFVTTYLPRIGEMVEIDGRKGTVDNVIHKFKSEYIFTSEGPMIQRPEVEVWIKEHKESDLDKMEAVEYTV